MTPIQARVGLFPSQDQDVPLYHEGLLEVKLRTDAGPLAPAVLGFGGAAGPAMFTRAAAAATPGLGTLMSYERSGLIRRVVPLAGDGAAPAVAGETPALAMFAAAAFPRRPDDPNAGVALVELYQDRDTQTLEAELRRDPAVESVSRVPVRYLLARKRTKGGATPAAAAPPATSLWNLTKIRWAEARARPGFKDATAIKVAVLDTGIDTGHPDRPANIAVYEFAHPTNAAASSSRDVIGHGTHVSGTIAARINNNVGINGICTCALHAFKIFDDLPDWFAQAGYFAYFVEPAMYQRALARCLTLQVNVVSLSIGGGGAPSANEQLLFTRLIQAGTTVVAAMGNENSSQPSYPAAIPDVVAVGATSIDDARASFSNFGGHVSVAAPGVGIWSTLPTYAGNMGYRARPTFPPQPDLTRPLPRDTNYAPWDGTSMATPHVTAAVALLLAKNGAMTPAAVKQKLQSTAVKVPGMQGHNFTQEFGYGRLDLVKLLT
jgi:hypothetical protein